MELERTNTASYTIAFIGAIAVILLLVSALPIVFTPHSLVSHGEYVDNIDSCFGNGAISNWLRSTTNGRWLRFCNDGGKHNYFRVYECNENGELVVVTQFQQVLRKLSKYLSNGGYVDSSGPPCK